MKSFFHWSMRNGAPILFAASILIVLTAMGPYLYLFLAESGRMASDHNRSLGMNFELLAFLNSLFAGINNAALPFLGAVLITIANRFTDRRDDPNA